MAEQTLSTKRYASLDEQERHRRRMSWFMAEAARQAANRKMRAICERAYDSEPLDPQKKAAIEARGQTATNHNEIAPFIDFLLGTERRMRIDSVVKPREAISPESDADAEVKTELLKFIDDSNGAGYERSYAFDDAMKSGLGWMEVGVRGDRSDVPIYKGRAPWRNMLHDSIGFPRHDLQDCRYIFRLKPVDLDIALAYFPGKKNEEKLLKVVEEGATSSSLSGMMMGAGGLIDLGLISGIEVDSSATMGLDLFNPRERVLLIECWSMEPAWSVNRKSSSAADRTEMKMHCSIMTEHDTLIEGPSPYEHNRFPFIPVWAYRFKSSGLPYSPIYRLLDKQQVLDDTMNLAVHEMATNQLHVEKGAISQEVMTLKQLQDELADPAGVAVFADGALQNGKVKHIRGLDKAQAHLGLAQLIKQDMQQESPVTAENLGRNSAADSGKAINLKQEQGSLRNAELFDNVLLSHQMEGEITLSTAEQYIVKPMVVTTRGERQQLKSVEINKPQDDGTFLNDITKMKARFIVGEQPWRATAGQAAFEQMMEMLGNLAPFAPQVVVAMLDLVFEYADIPNKESALERIRSITGQSGPNGKMTPAQQKAQEEQQQLASAKFQAEMAMLQAQVRKVQAEGGQLEIAAVAKALEAVYVAAQAAQIIGAAPLITPIADEILKSSGFKDQQGSSNTIDPASLPQQPQLMAPQLPDAQQTDGAMVGAQDGIESPTDMGMNQPQQQTSQE